MTEESHKMESLRDEIHEIMVDNLTPLEQKLRSQTLANCSIQELFETVADQYRQKQNQVTTMGKLVLHTIDLLSEEVNQKNELARDYEQTIEEYRIEQEDANLHIEQCETALQDYKDRIQELELQLTQIKQLRERYQTLYEQEVSSKSITDTFDTSRQGESLEVEKMEDDRHRMEINLLEYQIKQIKLEITRKDAQLLHKEQLRNHLNERVKNETQKNQALQGNFRVLQQNFRALVTQNDNLKKIIEQMEENGRQRQFEQMKQPRNRLDSFKKSQQKSNFLSKDHSQFLQDQSQQMRRSVSQAVMRKKVTDTSIVQPKKTLAFDLQSLHSGTSMLSPHASEIGKNNRNLFFQNNSKRSSKQATVKSHRSIVENRKRSRSVSEVSKSPARKTILLKKKPVMVITQQQPQSIFRRCLHKFLEFMVYDRLQR